MMIRFPLFISRKISGKDQARRSASTPAITIATIGVSVGLAVMIVSVSVVLGFKHSIRDRIIGFGSHITVADYMTLQTSEQYPIQIGDSMMKVLRGMNNVKHVQRYALRQGILKTDSDFLGIMFKGVGPEYDTTFIHDNLKKGKLPRFSDKSGGKDIVISQNIADKLKLQCGDRLFAYFVNDQGIKARRFTIAAIYETNLKRYDESICFTDIYTVNKLNGWEHDQYSGAEVTLSDYSKLDTVAQTMIEKVNRTLDKYGGTYSTATLTDLNPEIFSWIGLLDLNIWIIIALMTAVAAVTMVSGLLIIILERTQMIGLLKALGARNAQIRQIFLWFATFIIIKALLWGNIIGLGIVALQKLTGVVTLDPQTYYVRVVPVEINIPIFLLLNIATLVICVFVLVAPSYLISHIHPSKSMRYE